MALPFEKEFISHCKKQNLEINPSQIDLVKKLQEYYEGNFQSLISKIFQSKSFKKGFYLYGDVGVGKTMILDFFFDQLDHKKLRLHFNEFMLSFHNFVHERKGSNQENIINEFVKDLKSKALIIYFDEFQVTNIVDAMILGKLFDDKIEAVLEKPIPIAIVLIVGGIILLIIDSLFKRTAIDKEEDVSVKKAVTIGFWQCLAMMPGTSRAAASIIGGMQQGLTRRMAAEFSFFLAVPTMMAVTLYSVVLKDWNYKGSEVKGYEMITANNENFWIFILGNIIAFIVAAFAVKLFIQFIQKYGFKIWGWYRIGIGLILLVYFSLQ